MFSMNKTYAAWLHRIYWLIDLTRFHAVKEKIIYGTGIVIVAVLIGVKLAVLPLTGY